MKKWTYGTLGLLLLLGGFYLIAQNHAKNKIIKMLSTEEQPLLYDDISANLITRTIHVEGLTFLTPLTERPIQAESLTIKHFALVGDYHKELEIHLQKLRLPVAQAPEFLQSLNLQQTTIIFNLDLHFHYDDTKASFLLEDFKLEMEHLASFQATASLQSFPVELLITEKMKEADWEKIVIAAIRITYQDQGLLDQLMDESNPLTSKEVISGMLEQRSLMEPDPSTKEYYLAARRLLLGETSSLVVSVHPDEPMSITEITQLGPEEALNRLNWKIASN